MDKQQAENAGKILLSKLNFLGKGWKIEVWENLGWHCCAVNAPLTVYHDDSAVKATYYCLMSDDASESHAGSMLWSDGKGGAPRRDPNKSVAAVVAAARKKLNSITEAVLKAEKITGG